jgi:hypothetical protein
MTDSNNKLIGHDYTMPDRVPEVPQYSRNYWRGQGHARRINRVRVRTLPRLDVR